MKGRLLLALPLIAIGGVAAFIALGCTWEIIRLWIEQHRNPTLSTTHLLIVGGGTIAFEPWQFALLAAVIASFCLTSGWLLLDRDERDRS